MARGTVALALLVLVASPSARAQDAGAAVTAPRIEYSVASQQDDVLAAELPRGVEVDWEALARERIKDVDLDHPTAEQQRRLAAKYGRCDLEPQIHFDAPLPPEIQLYSFYLMTDSGFTELHPAKLCGSARVNVTDETGTSLRPASEGTAFYGTLCFEKGPHVPGGLLLITQAPIAATTRKIELKHSPLKIALKGAQLSYDWAEPGRPPLHLDWTYEHSPKPALEYELEIPGLPPLLYVRWGKDPEQAPCDEMVDLFELGATKMRKLYSLPLCRLLLIRPSQPSVKLGPPR